jgi:hypothetical protein
MNILFKHSGVLPVLKYGGTERIIFWLMKELVKQGHRVYLVGDPKSEVEKHGIKLIPQTAEDWRPLIPKEIDIIHLFYSPLLSFDRPLLITVEGNGKPGESFHSNTVFVSRNHAKNHSSDQFVYNGIDLDEYPFTRKPRKSFDNFLFLAKAKWKVKNLDHCIKAAKTLKKHLHIAGGRALSLSSYLHSYGMVAQQDKRELFEKSDALLWPVRWHEPFGIAIVEAFSQGLPVIGSPYGSLSELLQPEVGILCQNYAQFEEVLARKENTFDSEAIRQHLEENYSSIVMAKSYLGLYELVCSGEKLNQQPPKTASQDDPETLLPF